MSLIYLLCDTTHTGPSSALPEFNLKPYFEFTKCTYRGHSKYVHIFFIDTDKQTHRVTDRQTDNLVDIRKTHSEQLKP